MTSLRPFKATDVLHFNLTNLDPLTETYDLNFYFRYLAEWPHLFNVATGPNGTIDAYLMAKTESSPFYMQKNEHYLPWHAHITALTVAPHVRRVGIARVLSSSLEQKGDEYDAWFVDLFVRRGNKVAQSLYRGMGYSVFRKVVGYYSDDPIDPNANGEDAYDMRKPLKRDKHLSHVRQHGENFEVDPQDVW